MAFTGFLAHFSLPELFQFLQAGYKTGLLTITSSTQINQSYYIWLRQGRIVAAADSLDNQGLITMITRRGWMDKETALRNFQGSPINMAIGLSLKTQGLLQAEQLSLLFRAQLTSQVSPLFQLHDGQFEFDLQAQLPNPEMTGLSIPATEATLTSLRMLRDWSVLEKKLPEATSGLVKKIAGKPQLRLEYSESQVFEHANGKLSLRDIARTIDLPLEKVLQIAFRLMTTNLIEESFVVATQTSIEDNSLEFDNLDSTNAFGELTTKPYASKVEPKLEKSRNGSSSREHKTIDSNKVGVSQSYLQNLVGFLHSKNVK